MPATRRTSKKKSAPRPAGVLQRSTAQLRAVQEVFGREDRPLTPAEVLALAARDVPNLGLTTVYRLIKRLLQEKVITSVGISSQPARYERAGKPHHHHFLCLRCDKAYELGTCKVDFVHDVPRGFRAHAHDLLVLGHCVKCVR